MTMSSRKATNYNTTNTIVLLTFAVELILFFTTNKNNSLFVSSFSLLTSSNIHSRINSNLALHRHSTNRHVNTLPTTRLYASSNNEQQEEQSTSSFYYFANDVSNDSITCDDSSDSNEDRTIKNKKKTVVIAGATGYIGRAVVRESVRRGYNTLALVRDESYITSTHEGRMKYQESFHGATILECDVTNSQQVLQLLLQQDGDIDTIISCLASPIGTKKDAYKIDYQATLNCLHAGCDARIKSRHFVLLSAFCVRNPILQLQQAKLKFEAELTSQSDMTYSIVRPTAFFKSVSGQLEGIQQGAPYVLFGDGSVTRCNPISEEDLATYMMDCVTDKCRENRILNVGGPDEPLTNKMLGEMMFKAIGKEPKFVYAPTWIFDYIINALQFIADFTESEMWEDAAETARIGKYYAVQDMLTTDPTEKFGTMTMQQHYYKIASKGQDPFTPVRATAVISRVLEYIPALTASVPVWYAFTHPRVVEKVVDKGQLDISLLLASLSGVNFFHM